MFGEDHVVFRGNGGGSVVTCRVQTGGGAYRKLSANEGRITRISFHGR